MDALLVSAMLQSQQSWLPLLSAPAPFGETVTSSREKDQKFIAHCGDDAKHSLAAGMQAGTGAAAGSSLILIGPEGDFSQKEIMLALERGFAPVELGQTRLRSETAGVVAATLLCVG